MGEQVYYVGEVFQMLSSAVSHVLSVVIRLPRSVRVTVLVTTLAIMVAACATADSSSSSVSANAQGEKDVSMSEPKMVVRVSVKVKPDQEKAFIKFIEEEAAAVRAFAGCERYGLFASTEEPQTYLLYEEWASAEAFAAYKASPLLKKSFAVLGPMMAGPPDSAYFSATIAN